MSPSPGPQTSLRDKCAIVGVGHSRLGRLTMEDLAALVRRALDEDIGTGDVTTLSSGEHGHPAVVPVSNRDWP